MLSRDEVLKYTEEKYGITPDYPWVRTPHSAILRHSHNRKWFGAVFDVTEDKLGLDGDRLVDILNLKCNPDLIGGLIEKPGIFPAWHMNKEHWITILLSGSIPKDMVFSLLDLSFDLTK